MILLIIINAIDFNFFFKQKTAYEIRIRDWSSDVCSSDLEMETLDDFLSTVHYQSMDPADETTYFLLNDRLKELSPQYENNGNYLFYLCLLYTSYLH